MGKKQTILKIAFECVNKPQVFIDEEEIKQKVLSLSPKESRELGIKYRDTLKKIKDRILKDGKINIKTNEVKKLVSHYIR